MHNLLIVCLQRAESCRCVPAKELPIAIRGWLTRRNALFCELLPSHSAHPRFRPEADDGGVVLSL